MYNLKYSIYQEKHKSELHQMIQNLYHTEILDQEFMTDQKIEKTISFYQNNPQNGKIILVELNDKIIGYSILNYYWSNEIGGLTLFIDEILIKNEYRNLGIGSIFIEHLISPDSALENN